MHKLFKLNDDKYCLVLEYGGHVYKWEADTKGIIKRMLNEDFKEVEIFDGLRALDDHPNDDYAEYGVNRFFMYTTKLKEKK